jgi:hypothetical protein
MANTTIYNLPALNTVDSTSLFPLSSNVSATPTTYKASIGNIGNAITGNLRLSGDNITSTNNTINVSANSYVWNFGTDSNLTVPGAIGVPGVISVKLNNTSSGGSSGKGFDLYITAGNTTGCTVPGGNLVLSAGTGYSGVSHGNGNVIIRTGDYLSKSWNFDTTGNITLPGNTSSINYANGSPYGGSGNANTGNVTFTDINVIGTGNLHLQPDPANASAYLDIYLTAGPDIHIGGNGESVILGTDAFANVTVNVNGNVSVQANAGTPYTWTFGTTGNLTAPGNIVIDVGTDGNIDSTGNLNIISNANTWTFGTSSTLTLPDGGIISESASPTGLGNTIRLKPSGGSNVNQVLVIYPTAGEGDHLHLTAGGGNTELYLGDDLHYVKLMSDGNVRIQADNGANGAFWIFGTNGVITNSVKVFANLPSATTPGLKAFISDANLSPIGNFGVGISGGGSNYVPVFSDGANWCIG